MDSELSPLPICIPTRHVTKHKQEPNRMSLPPREHLKSCSARVYVANHLTTLCYIASLLCFHGDHTPTWPLVVSISPNRAIGVNAAFLDRRHWCRPAVQLYGSL